MAWRREFLKLTMNLLVAYQAQSVHDQKYRPLHLAKMKRSSMLTSTPIYMEIPVKAAMAMSTGE